MSNRVMTILGGFSPRHEVYSIDECFVDLTGIPNLRDVSYAMRQRVGQWTGIPVSKMLEGEKEKLLRMEEELHRQVVGQPS